MKILINELYTVYYTVHEYNNLIYVTHDKKTSSKSA